MKRFPKEIYVTRDYNSKPGEESILAWETKKASGDHGDKVAVYRLVEVKTLKITEDLV